MKENLIQEKKSKTFRSVLLCSKIFSKSAFIAMILMFCIITQTFAGGSVSKRTCWWFGNKYKATAEIFWFGIDPLCYVVSANCGGINFPGSQCVKTCGYQDAWITSWGSGTPGAIYQRICWRGNLGTDLVNDITNSTLNDLMYSKKLPPPPPPAFYEKNLIRTGAIYINHGAQNVVIDSINGLMESFDSTDIFTNYTITVWQASDDTVRGILDTVITPEKTIWAGSVTIVNGIYTITGFTSSSYTEYDSAAYSGLKFSNYTKTVSCSGHNMDEIVVTIRSDGGDSIGGEGKRALGISQMLNNNDKTFKVNLSPIPTSENLKIAIYSNDGTKANFKIYDEKGRMVKQIAEQSLLPGVETDLNINVADLSSGMYYLMTQTGNNKVRLDKFTIQK